MNDGTIKTLMRGGLLTYALVELKPKPGALALDVDAFLSLLDESPMDYRAPLSSQLPSLTDMNGSAVLPSPAVINACYCVDLLFDSLHENSNISPLLLNEVLLAKPLFLKLIIRDTRFFQSSSHYVRTLFDQLLASVIGCGDDLGEQGELLILEWRAVMQALNQLTGTEFDLSILQKEAVERFYQVVKQADASAHARRDDELNNVKSREPKRRVDELLDVQLAGREFPEAIARFFVSIWRNTLSFHFKKHGEDSEYWKELAFFTEELIQHFATNRESMGDVFISTMRPKIEKYLIGDATQKRKTYAVIDAANDDVLNRIDVVGVPISPFLEKNTLQYVHFNASILKTIECLKVGQWLCFRLGIFAHCPFKITAKMEESQEFLLVSYAGIRALVKSYEGLAYGIISRRVSLLDGRNIFNKCLVDSVDKLMQRYKQVRSQHAESQKVQSEEQERFDAIRRAELEAEKLRSEKAQMLAEADEIKQRMEATEKRLEAEARKAEEEKRLLEEKIREELMLQYTQKQEALTLKKQSELEALKSEKEKLERELAHVSDENRRYEIQRSIKLLGIGSWVSFQREGEKDQPCKIAIIYPSNKKYIFVNRQGVRMFEHTESELVDLLWENRASIIKSESSFDSSIETLIQSLKESK